MPRCFVIQPFDQGKFDKRYADVFRPAIQAAGLDAYRVDQDPSSSIPIEEIEAGIRGAAVCFADITTDNPNVWFELGFAIAEKKPTILVCSEERTSRFPFDVQHRSITSYKTDSPQDFVKLSRNITERLLAIIEKESSLGAAVQVSPIRAVEGLEQHEIVALVSVAENLATPHDLVGVFSVRQDMERAGFTRIATTLALASLLEKNMVHTEEVQGWNETYTAYGVTSKGMDWLMQNKNLLTLKAEKEPVEFDVPDPKEDDIPF